MIEQDMRLRRACRNPSFSAGTHAALAARVGSGRSCTAPDGIHLAQSSATFRRRITMKILAVHPSSLMYTKIFLRLEPLGIETDRRRAAPGRARGPPDRSSGRATMPPTSA